MCVCVCPWQVAMWRTHVTIWASVLKGMLFQRQCQRDTQVSRRLQSPGEQLLYFLSRCWAYLLCPCTIIYPVLPKHDSVSSSIFTRISIVSQSLLLTSICGSTVGKIHHQKMCKKKNSRKNVTQSLKHPKEVTTGSLCSMLRGLLLFVFLFLKCRLLLLWHIQFVWRPDCRFCFSATSYFLCSDLNDQFISPCGGCRQFMREVYSARTLLV